MVWNTLYKKHTRKKKSKKIAKTKKEEKINKKQKQDTRHKTQETLSIVYMYIFVKIALISKYSTKFGPQFS